MPLARRATTQTTNFDIPVSYRVNETRLRFRDALNVFSNQGRLETRHGISRYNSTALSGSPISTSYFIKNDGSRFLLAKVGTELLEIATSGAHTVVKSGLTSTTKHRGVTMNNRHIISIESDGLFQYDGTTFTQLGQTPPSAPGVAAAAGGSLTDSTYQVAVTFYASGTGFETNQGAASSNVITTGANNTIAVTSIPITADNATIDKVRVYLKDVTAAGDFLFVSELNLGTASTTITTDPTSTAIPPVKNAAPQSGGGKYMTIFNSKLVYAGNATFLNDVFFSEQDIPDGFDDNGLTNTVLVAPSNNVVTGLATGYYNNTELDPFLVIFKKRSVHIYSEIGGQSKFVTVSHDVGCVSHETIIVKNGSIFFLSTEGWRAISNGKLITDKQKDVITLGDGDIDDIFKESGFTYELNQTNADNFFSIYYSKLDQYMTFASEGSSTTLDKTWVYEFDVGGFKPWAFSRTMVSGVMGENSTGDEIAYLGASDGYFYTHSVDENRNDVDAVNVEVSIDAFAQLIWVQGPDFDATYNFRELIVRALAGSDIIDVKGFVNYDTSSSNNYEYDFSGTDFGFILDISKLDEGVFTDGRNIVTRRNDINRVGESLLIGFYQNALNANMNLVSTQLDFSKNGNRNL